MWPHEKKLFQDDAVDSLMEITGADRETATVYYEKFDGNLEMARVLLKNEVRLESKQPKPKHYGIEEGGTGEEHRCAEGASEGVEEGNTLSKVSTHKEGTAEGGKGKDQNGCAKEAKEGVEEGADFSTCREFENAILDKLKEHILTRWCKEADIVVLWQPREKLLSALPSRLYKLVFEFTGGLEPQEWWDAYAFEQLFESPPIKHPSHTRRHDVTLIDCGSEVKIEHQRFHPLEHYWCLVNRSRTGFTSDGSPTFVFLPTSPQQGHFEIERLGLDHSFLTLKHFTSAHFPRHFSLEYDLKLQSLPDLEHLPHDLTVRSLELRNCPMLQDIPSIKVRSLYIYECPGIIRIPHLAGLFGLTISDCSRIESLSAQSCVVNLQIRDCPDLVGMPDEMLSIRFLRIQDCPNLTSLPAKLPILEDLEIENCPRLSNWPDDLSVKKLALVGRVELERLPASLEISKDLIVSDSPALTCAQLLALLRGFEQKTRNLGRQGHTYNTYNQHGAVEITRCINLEALPQEITSFQALTLKHCNALRSLPHGLDIRSTLNITNCENFTMLPKELRVGQGLVVKNCSSVKSLPQGLRVRGDLILKACKNLSCLPDGLHVSGSLDLSDCTGLNSFKPFNVVKVQGDLDLQGCSNLNDNDIEMHLENIQRARIEAKKRLAKWKRPVGYCGNGLEHLRLPIILDGFNGVLCVGGSLTVRGCSSLQALPTSSLLVAGKVRSDKICLRADKTELRFYEPPQEAFGPVHVLKSSRGTSSEFFCPSYFWPGQDLDDDQVLESVAHFRQNV